MKSKELENKTSIKDIIFLFERNGVFTFKKGLDHIIQNTYINEDKIKDIRGLNMTINLEKFEDTDELYSRAVDIIAHKLNNGAKTFGLATGGTMISLYEKIRDSNLDFSHCTSVNLDEYVGISPKHPESYHTFMEQQLFHDKPFKTTYIPNGLAEDIHAEAILYEQLLSSMTLDLQLLGVGVNGHIGFNEPGTSFQSYTHVVKLAASTRRSNARFFNDMEEVPKQAITMGIASILRAECILLLAVGENKRAPIEALLKGDITEECPVTSLSQHKNVIVLTNLSFD